MKIIHKHILPLLLIILFAINLLPEQGRLRYIKNPSTVIAVEGFLKEIRWELFNSLLNLLGKVGSGAHSSVYGQDCSCDIACHIACQE